MLIQKNTGWLRALNATVRCGDADGQARERVAGSAARPVRLPDFSGYARSRLRSVLGGPPVITAQTD
jgi:hypothetical protein